MKISKFVSVAVIATGIASSAAYAANDQHSQRMAAENARYFQQKGQTSGMQRDFRTAISDNMQTKAYTPSGSQYPCGRCTYDHQAGGWVENPRLRR